MANRFLQPSPQSNTQYCELPFHRCTHIPKQDSKLEGMECVLRERRLQERDPVPKNSKMMDPSIWVNKQSTQLPNTKSRSVISERWIPSLFITAVRTMPPECPSREIAS